MSENLPLDNHIKEQLGGYSPDVPPHIWDQIVANRKQRKPVGFWMRFFSGRNLLLLGTLLLVMGGAAYWLTRPTESVPAKANLAEQTAPQTIATAPANAADATQPNNVANANTAPTLANANDATDHNKHTVDFDAVGTTGSSPTAMDAASASKDMAPSLKGPIGQHLASTPSAIGPAKIRSAKPLRLSTIRSKTPSIADADARQDGTGVTDKLDNDEETGRSNNVLATAASLPKMDGNAVAVYSPQAPLGELRNKLLAHLTLPDCPSIEDDAAANKKYVEIYGGPDFGLRSFGSFNSDTSSINYLEKRKESARFSSAFSVGMRYTKVFNNGMSLRSGINYSQINEKFLYINERDIRYILVITPRQITSGGNTITIYDTLRYTETGKRIKTTYNRYRSIDIPLQLGYEFGNGRLHTNISAGAIINLYSWHKGDMLDSTYQPVSITTGKGSSAYEFKTNIGVGFLGSLSLYYKLKPRLHVLAEPYFRYNLQPMSRDNQNVTQKYSTLGLRLGLRWDFK